MARTKDRGGIEAVVKRIRSVDDVDPWAKVLVFGHNGSGKTRFAASAPKCLILDINEMGTRSAVGSGARMIEINAWEEVGHIFWYLKAGDHPYESVAIDTITSMHNLAMRFVLGEQDDRDPSRMRDTPDKRTWGRSGELTKSMIWAFRNLPMHVVLTAQVRSIVDQDTQEVLDTTVDLPAGARGSATGAVGVLGYLEPKESKVRERATRKITTKWIDTMLVGPHRDYSCLKDRTNTLGPLCKRPTMPKVIEAWANIEGE